MRKSFLSIFLSWRETGSRCGFCHYRLGLWGAAQSVPTFALRNNPSGLFLFRESLNYPPAFQVWSGADRKYELPFWRGQPLLLLNSNPVSRNDCGGLRRLP